MCANWDKTLVTEFKQEIRAGVDGTTGHPGQILPRFVPLFYLGEVHINKTNHFILFFKILLLSNLYPPHGA